MTSLYMASNVGKEKSDGGTCIGTRQLHRMPSTPPMPSVTLNLRLFRCILGVQSTRGVPHMRRTLISLLIALSVSGAALADDDISKVNGSATVEAGQHAGDVHSVNGSVRIGDRA